MAAVDLRAEFVSRHFRSDVTCECNTEGIDDNDDDDDDDARKRRISSRQSTGSAGVGGGTFSVSLSLSHTHSLSLPLTHTHTHTLTHSLSLFRAPGGGKGMNQDSNCCERSQAAFSRGGGGARYPYIGSSEAAPPWNPTVGGGVETRAHGRARSPRGRSPHPGAPASPARACSPPTFRV